MGDFLDLVTAEIGVPYVYGGDTPAGFDCSGLVQWAAGKLNVDLPRGATAQMHALDSTSKLFGADGTDRTNAKPGDLIFFYTGDEWEAGHVGICADNGCANMVDAPHTGALVQLQSIDGFGKVVGVRRLGGQAAPDAGSSGGGGISIPGIGNVGTGGVDLSDLDPIDAITSLLGDLPGDLLKVFLGDHTVAELALRGVMIVGGALLLAAGAISFVVLIAKAAPTAGAAQGFSTATRPVRAGGRRLNAATTPQRAPRAVTRAGNRRLNSLQRARAHSGELAAES